MFRNSVKITTFLIFCKIQHPEFGTDLLITCLFAQICPSVPAPRSEPPGGARRPAPPMFPPVPILRPLVQSSLPQPLHGEGVVPLEDRLAEVPEGIPDGLQPPL